MARPNQSVKSIRKTWLLVAAIAICLLAFLSWPRSTVELSDHGYDLTNALYRACNQQSIEGISKIEQLIGESEPELSAQSHAVLTSIISQAKSGRWKEATVECRQALDDQVQR